MKGLYRGFCRNENGTETIVLNGEKIKGEWVQGNLVEIPQTIGSRFYIINGLSYYNDKYDFGSCSVEVIEETVCEAVRGLTDRNGKQVFEGDMFLGQNIFHSREERYIVEFQKNGFYAKVIDEETGWHFENLNYFEKIGTIFDEQFAEGV